jgi:hypothetical protein
LVQQTLLFETAKQAQMAQGLAAGLAGLHAAGVVFAIATLTGATRILGNPLASWLSRRTDQRNLGGLAAASRAAVLAAVAVLAFHSLWLSPAAALVLYTALYALDWFFGSLEDMSISTVPMTQVDSKSKRFKSWSTMPRFLAELNGFLGPLLILALVVGNVKGFDMVGHVLAPVLFGACAVFYFLVPKDLFHKAPGGAPRARIPWRQQWRSIIRNRTLALPVIALALLSTTLLKGPLSLNMASLILNKTGVDLKIYTALLSGIFGAGLGVGSWMAHVHDKSKSWFMPPAKWLAVSALGTAVLVFSWFAGYLPTAAFAALAAAWFLFALTNAACRLLMNHLLQEHIVAAGPNNNYVIGIAGSLSTAVITALRVLAGMMFFVMAGTWQAGFGLFGAVLLFFAASQLVISRLMAAPRATK